MTNEELDKARADHAFSEAKPGSVIKDIALNAARLARTSWTPPMAVDPDLAEAEKIEREYWVTSGIHPLEDAFMKAIKRGRALAAEAKPGMVWKKWDGSEQCPVKLDDYVWSKGADGGVSINRAGDLDWMYVTHYAIITPPEEDAA